LIFGIYRFVWRLLFEFWNLLVCMLKKLLVSLFVGLTVFFSFAPYLAPAKAQTWYDQSFQEWFGKVYDPANPSEIFGERYTAAQVQWIIYGLFSFFIPAKSTIQCIVSGDLSNCVTQILQGLGISDAKISPTLATKHQNLSSQIFATDRPISGIAYVKEKMQNFTLVPIAHAQTPGFGFNALSVVQSLWTASRNIVYGLFVLVAIIMAFMIMFRVKISPQVVISVQSAIPKIVVALILVTFSYAIAGFLVDLMYVVIGILSLALANAGGSGIFASDPGTVFKFLTTGYIGINSTIGVSVGIFGLLILYIVVLPIVLWVSLFAGMGGIVGEIASFGILGGTASLLAIIAFVVILVVGIFIGFKICWMLIKAAAQMLLLTIAAPFQIAFGTLIPGAGFSSWLKAFAANLAIFPFTGILFALSFLFLAVATGYAVPSSLQLNWWMLLSIIPGAGGLVTLVTQNTGWPPLLGGSNAMLGLVFVGVSFVIYTLIPKAGDVIKGLISGRPFAYGTAIGEAFGPAVTSGQAGIGVANMKRERQRENAARLAGNEYNPDTLTQILQQLKITGRK
jgi:hypothetical protein